jgi:FHS family L-fucose permease-like MFS transporter
MGFLKKRLSTVADDTVTNAAQLTLKQSMLPNILGPLVLPTAERQLFVTDTTCLDYIYYSFLSLGLFLAVACLIFWPSGIKKSFGGFCGSMFIVGAGLSTL